jgi:predicted metal-dependent hydrolase
MRVSREAIRDFVRARAGWIARAKARMDERPAKPAPPGYESGEHHPFLGQRYRLVVSRGKADAVELLVGCLCVTSRAEPSPRRVEALLERWYREQAEVVFAERLAVAMRLVSELEIPWPALRIRKMSSRWGSCSPNGRVNLNLWLVKAPVECIDYVVVHELCHFRVRSHGPRFWRLVARFVPDYAALRKRLNDAAG